MNMFFKGCNSKAENQHRIYLMQSAISSAYAQAMGGFPLDARMLISIPKWG